MIEIPVHNAKGNQIDALKIDEMLLGGELRPQLLKQAFVRYHANRRQGSAKTKSRSETAYSTRKLYRQKGTGNARRGPAGTNLMRGGGHTFAKRPRSFRKDMPRKMRRLANRNALLAKAIDGEIKLIDSFQFVPGLLPFHMGAFLAAAETNTPVVPIAIRGTRSILRADSWFPRHGAISVFVGEPIFPDAIGAEAGDSAWTRGLKIRDRARREILRYCGEPDLGHERPPLWTGTPADAPKSGEE